MSFSSDPNDWQNFCTCGEYLGPTRARCDDKKWGCGQRRVGLYCEKNWLGRPTHTWIAPKWRDAPTSCSTCGMTEFWTYLKTLEWDSKDPAYWRDIFLNVDKRTFSNQCVDMVDEIKKQRYEHRRPKPKQNDYGPRINDKLERLISAASRGYDCVGGYRYALKSSRRDMKRFHRDRDCCGNHVETVRVEFREYVIGFSYGH